MKSELKLDQKVTVCKSDGSPLTAGTVEAFPVITGTRGAFDAVKVREAGLNVIVALPDSVRPWREGDPQPQERRYVDQPKAIGRTQPCKSIPVVAVGDEVARSLTGNRRKLNIAGAWDALKRVRKAKLSTQPEPEQPDQHEKSLQEIIDEVNQHTEELNDQ